MQIQVNIDVDDLAKGIAFYASGLGLLLERLLFDGSVAEMLGAASPIYLVSKPSGSAAVNGHGPVRDYQRH